MDEELILEAKNFLELYDLIEIWNTYLSIEWLRAYGVYPGLGIFKKNLFIEFYFESSFDITGFSNWVNGKEFEITFLTFSNSQKMLRVFLVLVNLSKTLDFHLQLIFEKYRPRSRFHEERDSNRSDWIHWL
jgi:hypothetical protein